MRSLLAASCAALLAACGSTAPAPDPEPGPETCADGVRNQGETAVDCGGPCAPCDAGDACDAGFDCASGVCEAGACMEPSCADGVQNGDETAIDCGGPGCMACGVECVTGDGCPTGICLDGACDCGDDVAVYVSAAGGLDGNPGTATAPLRTVQGAVECAKKVPREIRVAEGTYEGPVELAEGRSLVGGWSADFGQRSPVHQTVIQDTTDTGTIGSGVAVYLRSASTATVIEGFTIQATTLGAGIAAIALMVAQPPAGVPGATVRNNVIQCGGNPSIFGATCIDLGTSGGSLVVESNELHLGTASAADGTAWGIRYRSGAVSSLAVVGNLFEGGSSATVVALETPAGSTAIVRNNVFVVPGAGTAVDDGSGAEISNNTIVAETGTAIRANASGSLIRNNAIAMSGGICVEEHGAGADPASVQGNDLFGCATLYLDEGASALQLADIPADGAPDPDAPGNLSADPLLDAANGHRPLSGSPLLDAGQDLSSLFTTDKDGVTRAAPWSIGAYELP